MENELRAMHTMTINEFCEWSKNVFGDINDENTNKVWILEVMDNTFQSLSKFYSFLSCYGNFDSITWLIENGFDVSFSHARKNGRNKL